MAALSSHRVTSVKTGCWVLSSVTKTCTLAVCTVGVHRIKAHLHYLRGQIRDRKQRELDTMRKRGLSWPLKKKNKDEKGEREDEEDDEDAKESDKLEKLQSQVEGLRSDKEDLQKELNATKAYIATLHSNMPQHSIVVPPFEKEKGQGKGDKEKDNKSMKKAASAGATEMGRPWSPNGALQKAFSKSADLSLAHPPQKLTVSCEARGERVTISTFVDTSQTIREASKRLQQRFPDGMAVNCTLGINTKKGFKPLQEDKHISAYLKKLDLSKVELILANIEDKEKDKPKSKTRKLVASREVITASVFHDAIVHHDIEKLSGWLTVDADYMLDELDEVEGQAPIHAAVRSNDPRIMELFLQYYTKRKLDVNIKDRYGWTILHHAVSTCTGTQNDDRILSMILNSQEVKVDVNNEDKNTPLHYFCQKFLAPSCLEFGTMLITKAPFTVNRKNRNGETPLHKAIFNPAVRVLMVKLLIDNGADVNTPNSIVNETAMHYAVRLQRIDLVKILLHAGADLTIEDTKEKKTPYQLAVQFKELEIMQTLKHVDDLSKWLQKHELKEHLSVFVKEDLYIPELMNAYEQNTLNAVLDKIEITTFGTRIRIQQACKQFQAKYHEQEFESRVGKARRKSSSVLTPEVKESLTAILHSANGSWLIPHSNLEFTKELGAGTSGKVYKGLLRGTKVAIKVLQLQDQTAVEEFKQEFSVMGTLQHDNIIHFFGACLEPKLCIVMEYCNRGSLHQVLNKKGSVIEWGRALQFMIGMAKGMNFLHSRDPPVFHRDMKSMNLLLHCVDNQWHIKVADFGLARVNNKANASSLSKMRGTYNYVAPECVRGMKYSEKADVYSMGIIMWEIVHRVIYGQYQAPYQEYKNIEMDFQIAIQAAEQGLRPTTPESCVAELRDIIQKALDASPEKRPTTEQLLNIVLGFHSDYTSAPEKWVDSIQEESPHSP